MGSHNLPSPPAEDPKSVSRKSSSSTKSSSKQANRISKRAGSTSSSAAAAHHHDHHDHASMDGRHKRVWKACERCRMKKTKCDGEFPCKRCKDDGLVCTAGVRKKVEYKQLPKGYAEVLENTQFALIATVHKLYSMVRNSQSWELGEPELNDRGQPVIHNIAQKLGCIRPNSDIDLPVHSVFPEDERGMQELAMQLEEQQRLEDSGAAPTIPMAPSRSTTGSGLSSMDTDSGSFQRASSSDLDHSDFEHDYRAMAFGGDSNTVNMSPQSFTTSNTDFDLDSASLFPPTSTSTPAAVPRATTTTTAAATAAAAPRTQQRSRLGMANYQTWQRQVLQDQLQQQMAPKTQMAPDAFNMQFMQQQTMMSGLDLLGPELQNHLMNQGLVESEFGTLKPHVLSGANSEVMMGMGDPMIFAGAAYDGEL